MRRDNQSETVCCRNAKLGRAIIFVDENVILKCTFDEFLDPCSGGDDRDDSPVISKAVD